MKFPSKSAAFLLLVVVSFPATLFAGEVPVGEEPYNRRYHIEYFGVRDVNQEMFLCVLLPYRECQITLDSGIGYGGGRGWGDPLQPYEENDYMQFFFDGSVLFRVTESPSLQLGPLIGFDLELFDESRRFHFYTGVRNRLWAGRWIAFDLAVGAVGSLDENWNVRGFGGLGEISISAHGHIGAFIQTQILSGPENLETRVTGGIRGSFVAWAVVFAGMGG